jgi:hypothetical protein
VRRREDQQPRDECHERDTADDRERCPEAEALHFWPCASVSSSFTIDDLMWYLGIQR